MAGYIKYLIETPLRICDVQYSLETPLNGCLSTVHDWDTIERLFICTTVPILEIFEWQRVFNTAVAFMKDLFVRIQHKPEEP